MQEQPELKAAQLTLCSFSVTPISNSQHKIAVLASTPPSGVLALQLLSISNIGKPLVTGTHLVTASLGTTASSATTQAITDSGKWRCCYSKYGEVLLHKENGPAFIWSLSQGIHASSRSQWWTPFDMSFVGGQAKCITCYASLGVAVMCMQGTAIATVLLLAHQVSGT